MPDARRQATKAVTPAKIQDFVACVACDMCYPLKLLVEPVSPGMALLQGLAGNMSKFAGTTGHKPTA